MIRQDKFVPWKVLLKQDQTGGFNGKGLGTLRELEDLETAFKNLSNFEAIRETLNESYHLLNDHQMGIIQSLSNLSSNLKQLADFSTQYESISDRTRSVLIELQDIFADVEMIKDNLEADPQKLNLIADQLNAINDNKYCGSFLNLGGDARLVCPKNLEEDDGGDKNWHASCARQYPNQRASASR